MSRLASLLAKFRIEYSDLIVITDVMAKAKESTREFFDGLLKEYRKNNEDIMDDGEVFHSNISNSNIQYNVHSKENGLHFIST